ncbi:transporter substrate-binding domain-containing protein [Paraburkholderia panacisoli]|uniref:Transporter substrate-binding domain-containing protein n=1 Tax=Paraburkholderia panacisoli TaxID=2603818 RepID=A0A5B0GXY1_9BURK|nr:transporter substrate-binding domain-containing protein [Paraburkholderia panacisoli]KAA1007807.1 transporter substrate-binding domain-containing protein [Paraburkholderia panacisoli]
MISTNVLKASLATLLGVLALAGNGAQAKEWKTVKVALEGSYAPWNLTLPSGTISGFEPELLDNLCKRINLQCDTVAQDFDGLISGLQAGKFDVVMDALAITPDREKVIAFSKPYAATPAAFARIDEHGLASTAGKTSLLKLTGDPKTDRAMIAPLRDQLRGKSIGIQSGTVYTRFITDNFKDITSVRLYKTSAERDLDLVNGRVDMAFDDVTYYAGIAGNKDTARIRIAGPAIGGAIWGPGEGLGFRKQDTELKAKFDAAITAALADGTVARLSEKWFKADVQP